MKTAGRRTQTRYATVRSKPSLWSGALEQILLNNAGWKVRKNPAAATCFFLTFPFIELTSAKTSAGLGVGINGMREHIRQFGGALLVLRSEPGTLIEARIPLFGYFGLE